MNKKDSYLRAQFHCIKARRGAKKAIIAVAASVLTAIYQCSRLVLPTKTSARSTLPAAPRPSKPIAS